MSAVSILRLKSKAKSSSSKSTRMKAAGNGYTASTQKSAEPQIVLRRATRADVARMSRLARPATPHQAIAAGLNPKQLLWKSFHSSIEAWAMDIDGEFAAVGGLGGCFLSEVGEPWLYTTPAIEKYPYLALRVARAMIDTMAEITPRLEGFIFADYPQGIRFLRALGFSFGETVAMGPRGAPFIKFSRGP